MLYGATKNGERTLAKKNIKATCPYCKGNLIAKCGDIIVHHWAHKEAKTCPYSQGMTQWHYKWLANYDELSSHGWQVEYLFENIRFDAYNPETKQAIEFQRMIDIDYISKKIQICQQAGIKIFWVINPKIFENFVYTNNFFSDKCNAIFASRGGKRKVAILLKKYINHKSVTFLIDFRKTEHFPKYLSDSFQDGYAYNHEEFRKGYRHPMKPGMYLVDRIPNLRAYRYRNKFILILKYHKSRFNLY